MIIARAARLEPDLAGRSGPGHCGGFEPPSGHRTPAPGGFRSSAIEPGREIHLHTADPAEPAAIIRRAVNGQAGDAITEGNDHAPDHPVPAGLRPLRLLRMRPAELLPRLLLRIGRL